jgi:alpha-beta hydrolase superfamily lysophospholipase
MTTEYTAPAGLRTRGTVLIVPGRGESPATYQRLGRRLAADAYLVRVLAPPVAGPLNDVAGQLAEAVDGTDPVRPLVLLGADTGAAAVTALIASRAGEPSAQQASWWPAAVIAAGLPGYQDQPSGGWDDELDVRTQCPAHRGVLTGDPSVRRGALSDAIPRALLDEAYGSTADLPHLLLVGDDDPLADRDALDRTAKALPAARLTVVREAHHDVLNDLQHRSVAAEIVLFLEALRGTPALDPIITVQSSAW